MSYSYSGDPAASDKDAVRFEIGDTNEKTQLIQDEEIYYSLQKEGTVLKAAARCAESLAARFAREENVRTSTFASLRSMLQQHYEDLAKKLRVRGQRRGNFVCPSMTHSGKMWNRLDRDLNLGQFFREMGWNTGTKGEDKTSG